MEESVFLRPFPSLVGPDVTEFLASDDSGSEATLRMALLWGDLQAKVDHSPTAMLGLLDIASSREVRGVSAIRGLEPMLARAARKAADSMPASDAWPFLVAMVRKIHEFSIDVASDHAIRTAIAALASRSPAEAIDAATHADGRGGAELLVTSIAQGLALGWSKDSALRLGAAPPSALVRLLTSSESLARQALSDGAVVSDALAQALPKVDKRIFQDATRKLLALLVEDWHAPPAVLMIETLGESELIAEARILYEANKFAGTRTAEAVISRAQEVGAEAALRDALVAFGPEPVVDEMVVLLLRRNGADLAWVLDAKIGGGKRRISLLTRLLASSSAAELRTMLSDERAAAVLSMLPTTEFKLLGRIVKEVRVPLVPLVELVARILDENPAPAAVPIVEQALERAMQAHFSGDEVGTLVRVVDFLDGRLDARWLFQRGADRAIPSPIVSRNLVAFSRANSEFRSKAAVAVDDLARALENRNRFDLGADGADACAALLWSAEGVAPGALLRAAFRLLPILMRARSEPASAVVAAVFPAIYLSLAKSGDVPDVFRLFIFVEWDRRKVARRELVDAFLGSRWRPSDLALAGARARDLPRILQELTHRPGGVAYLKLIERDLPLIPAPWRDEVDAAVREARGGRVKGRRQTPPS